MVQADGILDRMSGLARDLRLANLQPQIAACCHHLHGSEKIDVAVFGRFKAGKSSFLNHLTGRAVLPIGVVPLTAVITRLRYRPAERAEVRFLDGRRKRRCGPRSPRNSASSSRAGSCACGQCSERGVNGWALSSLAN